MPAILDPLNPVKEDLLVLSGLAHDKARPNGDGAGDHARASATFLTGCQARKTHGADIKVGVSIDQAAAQKSGKPPVLLRSNWAATAASSQGIVIPATVAPIPTTFPGRQNRPPCRRRWTRAWSSNGSFSSPAADESKESRAKRERYQKSILDFVLEDANRLKANLGHTDRRKLDEY